MWAAVCEPKHKMWVLHLSHATAVKSLKCLLLSLRAEKQRCHIKSFRAWLDQYKQTRVSLFKPVPQVVPQTKLTLAPTVWREPSQIPLTVGLRGSPWLRLRLRAAVAGRFHPHWQLGSSKLEPPQLRRELYNATERGSLIQATIRQSETVLVLSAARRLHCLTAQTTMPRAEITGNASLSDRGEKQRERQRESVMASSLFTYRLIEKKKRPLCPRNKKEFGVYTSVSPEQIFFVQVAFVSRKCRKKYHERRQIHHFLNLSSITLPLICLDWVTSRGEFV